MNISSATVTSAAAMSWPKGSRVSAPDAVQNGDASSPQAKDAAQGVKSQSTGSGQLDTKAQSQVDALSKRDRVVRAHEAAHVAAGGSYVKGGATFQYTMGPDGRMYATGGEVSIDVSTVANDPKATIRKMQVVQRAALAPAEPSAQDRSVASTASQEETRARMELTQAQLKSYQSTAQSADSASTSGSTVDSYA